MSDITEDWKQNWREEEYEGGNNLGAQKISHILRGTLEGNNRNLGPALEYIYLVGKSDDKGVNELSDLSNYISRGTISNFTGQMSSEGVISVRDSGNKKIPELTEDGEEIFQRVKPLFEPIDKISEVKQCIQKFRSRYEREPSIEELSNLLNRKVEEEEVFETGLNYDYDVVEEPREYIKKKISAAFLVSNTSAKDADIDEEGILTLPGERNESGVLDYVADNEGFLENLEIEHKREETFAIKLNDEARYVLKCEEIQYRVWLSEKVEKDELLELAD
jgi:DNA-binding PadR family transcriptional regulator